ncbi:MAG: MBL fold metallo-hydrolase [Acidobacteriota bacterium]
MLSFWLAAGLGASAVVAAAQQPPAAAPSAPPQAPAAAPVQLTVTQLRPNIYEIEGGGGNSTVIVGSVGVIVVDAKTTEAAGRQLVAEVAKITPKPITTLIETHSDGDHVNGVAGFPMPLTIIAHEGNRKEQQAALAAGGRGAPPPGRLPTQVVSGQKETVTIAGVKLELYHWGPAHTSGDLVVYVPDRKLVATGDIIVTNRSEDNPNIHAEKNGSTAGWIANAKGMALLDADTYVTGHGTLLTKADLQARAKRIEDRRAKIEAMVKQGKTLDEIKTALPEAAAPTPTAAPATAAAPAPPGAAPGPQPATAPGGPAAGAGRGGGGAPAPSFTELAYQELTKK